MEKVLMIVDVQYDFMEGGALEVPDANSIIEPINKLLRSGDYKYIFFSKDYHPTNHCSFKKYGGQWPKHCVQGTNGAAVHNDIVVPLEYTDNVHAILKGQQSSKEEYSGIDHIPVVSTKYVFDVVGLVTDYCVKETALDLVKSGYTVNVHLDCCRGVAEDTTKNAIDLMKQKGIVIKEYRE
jgi:nicotinamidase/pyrazinamidase